MNEQALELVTEVFKVAAPFAITFRVCTWAFNTIIDWITGRSDKL